MKKLICIVLALITIVGISTIGQAEDVKKTHPDVILRESCPYGCGNFVAFHCGMELRYDGTTEHQPFLKPKCTITWYESRFYEYCHYCERMVKQYYTYHTCEAHHTQCNDVIWCTAEFRD